MKLILAILLLISTGTINIQDEVIPSKFDSFVEDDALKVRFHAEMESDKFGYKTTIVFTNKTANPLDIVADCGLFFSTDIFALKSTPCAAVDSMLVKNNRSETQVIYLPKEFFYEQKGLSVKYRQGQTVKTIKLQLRDENESF